MKEIYDLSDTRKKTTEKVHNNMPDGISKTSVENIKKRNHKQDNSLKSVLLIYISFSFSNFLDQKERKIVGETLSKKKI